VYFSTSIENFYKDHDIQNKENIKIFLSSLLAATQLTLKVLLQLEDIKIDVQIVNEKNELPQIYIGALAGIVSAHFTGNLVICFSQEVFKQAMGRFLQMPGDEVSVEMKDGAAEFLNVIIGQTKVELNDIGFDIKQVIPTLISGDHIEIGPMSKQSHLKLTIKSDIGDLYILVSTNAPVGDLALKR
jgi:CheY-specific phosphatase CheX